MPGPPCQRPGEFWKFEGQSVSQVLVGFITQLCRLNSSQETKPQTQVQSQDCWKQIFCSPPCTIEATVGRRPLWASLVRKDCTQEAGHKLGLGEAALGEERPSQAEGVCSQRWMGCLPTARQCSVSSPSRTVFLLIGTQLISPTPSSLCSNISFQWGHSSPQHSRASYPFSFFSFFYSSYHLLWNLLIWLVCLLFIASRMWAPQGASSQLWLLVYVKPLEQCLAYGWGPKSIFFSEWMRRIQKSYSGTHGVWLGQQSWTMAMPFTFCSTRQGPQCCVTQQPAL